MDTVIDNSKSNPALHYLYVTWAMQHLVILRSSIKKLSRSNINWHGPVAALIEERAKLLKSDAAYQEAAWRILAGHIVKPKPRDNGPEGEVPFFDSGEDNLSIYDTVSETWVEKPAPGIFKPAATLGTDQTTLDAVKAMQNNGEPGHINVPGMSKGETIASETGNGQGVVTSRREKRKQKRAGRTQGGALPRNQAEIVRQGIVDRKRRKRMTNGMFATWTYAANETTPRQLHGKYGTMATAAREASRYRQETGRPCKVSKPNGFWAPDA